MRLVLRRHGVLTRNQQQEGLCRAFVHLIIARCGMSHATPYPDCGIDLTAIDILMRGNRRIESGFKLDIQAKSTTLANLEPEVVKYDLDIQAYDDLRDPAPPCPRLLVVLALPDEEDNWLVQT